MSLTYRYIDFRTTLVRGIKRMALYQSELIKILKMLSMIKERRNLTDMSICMLGVQKILINHNFTTRLERLGIEYDAVALSKLSLDSINTFAFFELLGYKNVHAIDFSSYEGADLLYDLNIPLPVNHPTFDVVLNIGTLEHIYNASCAMDNITCLANLEGTIVNICPSAGYVDHGFYSFSPCFFEDYYNSKGIELIDLFMEVIQDDRPYDRWRCFYTEDLRNFEDWDGKDGVNRYIDSLRQVDGVGRVQIWSIAKKNGECNKNNGEYPVQRIYQDLK